MSEENTPIPAAQEDDAPPTPVAPSADWFLQTLVDMANEHDMEFGVTIFVGGAMITGLLISGQKYFDVFAKEFSEGWPDLSAEVREELRASFAGHGRMYTDPDFKSKFPPSYVHLRDTHVYLSGDKRLPDNRGVLWRGRLSEVGGFCMGLMKPAE